MGYLSRVKWCNVGYKQEELAMKIEKFWMVTKPGLVSEMGDICFETDAKGLAGDALQRQD